MVKGKPVTTTNDVKTSCAQARKDKCNTTVILAPMEKLSASPGQNVPFLHFDQLNIMSWQHHATRNYSAPLDNPHNPPPTMEPMVLSAMACGHIQPHLTRSYLQQQHDWDNWAKRKRSQLNSYHSQNMFANLIPRPPNANILPLLWMYVVNLDGRKKARCICNGLPSRKGSVTIDHTYAAAHD